ncbi:MAG: hypothetical protein RMY36_032405 [Nostoc sp. SerVER01]|nr:hypothetical protein [Nostoc sp. SerVER01]
MAYINRDPDSLIPKLLEQLKAAEQNLSALQAQCPTQSYPCESLQKLILEFSPETRFSASIATSLDKSLEQIIEYLKAGQGYLREWRNQGRMTEENLWNSWIKLQDLIKELEAKF